MYYFDDDDDDQFLTPYCPYCPMYRQKPMPFGPPSGTPFGPSYGPPKQPPQKKGDSGPPSGPPPKATPSLKAAKTPGLKAVDPGALKPCTFRFVYLWLKNGREFWAWLVFVGPQSAAGWRWNGYRWVYFGVDLKNIESFECY